MSLKNLILCFLVVIGNVSVAFSQNYLTAEQDVGFDIARTIVADATIRTEPKYTSPVVTTFKLGYNLTLINRKTVGGWYEVSDINTLKRGWIHGNQITLYYSNGNFRQVVKIETKCLDPLYLKASEDNGYDLVKVKNQQLNKAYPYYPKGYRKGDRKIIVRENAQMILLSREIFDFDTGNSTIKALKVLVLNGGDTFLKEVLDNEKLEGSWTDGIEIGYVDCAQFQSYYTTKKSEENLFVKQRSSNSYAAPVTTVQNDADRDLTLFVDEVKYVIPSKTSRTLYLPAGRHNYIATAPGVIPLSGSDVWEQGYVYNWTFYIETRYR